MPRCPLTADCSRLGKTLVKARAHRRRDPGTRDAARECDGRYALAQTVMAGGVAASIDDPGLALIFPYEDGTVIDAAGQPVGAAVQTTDVSGTGLAVATVRRASRTVAEVRYRAERAGAEQLLGKVNSPLPLILDLAVIRPALQMGRGWARCDAATESPVTSGRERRTPPRPNPTRSAGISRFLRER